MLRWVTVWRVVAGVVALTLAVGAVAVGLDVRSVSASRADYSARLQQLNAELARASQAGYDGPDVSAIRRQASQLSAQPSPLAGVEPGFYGRLDVQLRDLHARLQEEERRQETATRQDIEQQVSAIHTLIQQDQASDVPDTITTDLEARAQADSAAESSASTMTALKKADTDAHSTLDAARKALADQQAENAVLQQAAAALAGQAPAALRQAGRAALAAGRNDASLAAYEEKGGRFAAAPAMHDAYWRLEHYAPRLDSPDPGQLALGTAAVQRYAGQIHQLLMDNLGPKHIVVSFTAQHVWAYENGKVVMESPVTTGIQGVGPFGTDFGPMQVLHKDHPWKMHSPWPKGSPYWYPDTVVQWAVFFTWSGEAFHDASWEPDSELGPGSQFDLSTRSHGCVHLPYSLSEWLYGWAEVGTPVDVYPGDGKPVADQLAEITTDNQGNPLNPA